ncbi:hypothetical protein FLW53_38145 [Microbispora sp. SCL1-1]|nr:MULTISPECIES: hypothetical protein [unclassified Microbispora]NJP29910.1 hypothetical protein [Microbispora sp. CL1-1]TQS03553.1 hypothetical protein FLW53_38145 [Microbispora sp. SCL1-1]
MVTVDRWLKMDDNSAIDAIDAFVSTSSVADVDNMDAVLFHVAVGSTASSDKARLIRFYTIFKVAELVRFEQFRGFPAYEE